MLAVTWLNSQIIFDGVVQGLGVAVITDATGFSIVPSGDNVDLVYPGMTTMRLEINPAL